MNTQRSGQRLTLGLTRNGGKCYGLLAIMERPMPERDARRRRRPLNRRDWLKATLGGGAGLALGGAPRRPRVQGRDARVQAVGRQRVHDLLQLLLVRVRHDRRGPRRQAADDGGRLRPHREPRVAVREGHVDVRDARLAAAAQHAALPRAGQRPLGGHHLGRGGRARRAEDRKTRDKTWIATEKVDAPDLSVDRARAIGSRTPAFIARGRQRRCRSIAPTRSPSWAARRTPTRSATSFRRRPACSAPPSSSIRPGFDIAPRSPVWGPHSVAAR